MLAQGGAGSRASVCIHRLSTSVSLHIYILLYAPPNIERGSAAKAQGHSLDAGRVGCIARQKRAYIYTYISIHCKYIHVSPPSSRTSKLKTVATNNSDGGCLAFFSLFLSFWLGLFQRRAWAGKPLGRALFFCAIYAITSNLCLPLHIYLLFHSHILLGIVCSVFNTHHAYRVVCNNNECIIPHASQSRLLRQEEAKGPAGSRDCRLRRRRRSLSSRPPFPSSDNHKMAAQPCSIGRLLWLFCSTRKRPAAPKKKKRKEGPTTLCCSPPTSSLPFL